MVTLSARKRTKAQLWFCTQCSRVWQIEFKSETPLGETVCYECFGVCLPVPYVKGRSGYFVGWCCTACPGHPEFSSTSPLSGASDAFLEHLRSVHQVDFGGKATQPKRQLIVNKGPNVKGWYLFGWVWTVGGVVVTQMLRTSLATHAHEQVIPWSKDATKMSTPNGLYVCMKCKQFWDKSRLKPGDAPQQWVCRTCGGNSLPIPDLGVGEYNLWHCLACEDKPILPHKEFLTHAKDAHGIKTGAEALRSPLFACNGFDFTEFTYEWTIAGLVFVQKKKVPREPDGYVFVWDEAA